MSWLARALLAVTLFLATSAWAIRMSDVQAQIDACPSYGCTIALPAEEIQGASGEEIVITKPVRLVGQGMNLSDSQLSRGRTQFTYTGSGVAIQIGTPGMTAPLYGVELKDFTVKGTTNGAAGVRVIGNVSQGILVARVLIENVDARDFKGGVGVGFDLQYGISVTLRRAHAHMNVYGIRIRWGNAYVLEGVIVRHNAQGIRADAFNGLAIIGGSVLESNDNSALAVMLEDNSRHLVMDGVWIENNNTVPSGVNDAVYIAPSIGGVTLKGWIMRDVSFDGGMGHISMTGVDYWKWERIRWNNGTFYP